MAHGRGGRAQDAASLLAGVVPLPGLTAVMADPAVLERLPLEALLGLRRQLQHLDVELGAAIARQPISQSPALDAPRVMDVVSAAEALKTSPDSLYRKRKRLRLGYIDALDGRLKFTEQEIA